MIKKFLKKIPHLRFCFNKIKQILNKIKIINEPIRIYLAHKKIKKVIELKKEKILNGSKIRVAFFITQKQLWNSQTVYDNLLSNDLFEPVIVTFPNCEDKVNSKKVTCEDNYNFFESKKMNVVLGYDINNNLFLNLNDINADIIFYDQTTPNLPNNLLWDEAGKNSLVCYIPYGYKVAKFYEAHFNSKLTNNCWAIFAESDWHKKQFKKFGLAKGKNVVVSGYPKLDVYNIKNDNLDSDKNTKKIIIWAPHWSIKNSSIEYSTFDKYYKFFIQYATNNKDIFWVFKPHQRLRYYLEEIGFMTKDKINDYYKQWDKLPNCQFYNDSDYFDLFKNSNALITDCGSFLAEYLPTKNPIMLLVSGNSAGYNEIGDKLVNTYYKAFNENDVKKFINNVVIKNNDFLKEKRLKNLDLVQPNPGGAGKFIVNHIRKILIK